MPPERHPSELDALCIDTLRTLAMDAVERAGSGHPGTPMGLAAVAYTLWQRHLVFDPDDPAWPGRDRFVLSNGHASLLLYGLLHLGAVRDPRTGGEAVPLDEIRRYRQLGSLCPGHPEHGLTAGVETTTGPLGQGVASSVGMALAGRWLAETYDRTDAELFGYRVWALCGDGDLMEGVSGEAASLAGHLRLPNLTWIYDDNRITIEGPTSLAFHEDLRRRFEGYGWAVLDVPHGTDLEMLDQAFAAARASDRPTLIRVRTHIGLGSPHKQDTKEAHGEPLGAEEVRATKRCLGWPEDAAFLVPEGVREHMAEGFGARGRAARREWDHRWIRYNQDHPASAQLLHALWHGQLPEGWDLGLRDLDAAFKPDPKGLATRESSGKVLGAIARNLPWMIGGSADLAPSTKTLLTFEGASEVEPGHLGGCNLHFGIREHAMAAALNGLALAGLRPFGATFLVFTDYARPALRLAALMELPVTYVLTHDSIGLGGDGPTHQPVEHLASLRAMPGMTVVRPADAQEVLEAWKAFLPDQRGPVALVLTRQAVPTFDRGRLGEPDAVKRGGYILRECRGGDPDVILLASGSEVHLCLQAAEALEALGLAPRVVSMPCWSWFEAQPQAYRDAVLPPEVEARVAVEAASPLGWERYVGLRGAVIGMTTFGASAPGEDAFKAFGFTVDRIVEAARVQAERGHLAGIRR